MTVLLTTQYLDEADQLADEIVVVDHGRVIATGTPEELKAQDRRADARGTPGRPAASWTGSRGRRRGGSAASPRSSGDTVSVPVTRPGRAAAVVRRLDDAGIVVAELALRSASLDEVFLALTGHRAEDRRRDREDDRGEPA